MNKIRISGKAEFFSLMSQYYIYDHKIASLFAFLDRETGVAVCRDGFIESACLRFQSLFPVSQIIDTPFTGLFAGPAKRTAQRMILGYEEKPLLLPVVTKGSIEIICQTFTTPDEFVNLLAARPFILPPPPGPLE